MPNVALTGRLPLSPARALALGAWGRGGDPSIYGLLEVDARPLLAWLRDAQAASGRRLTVTHAVAKLLADVLAEHPEANVRLRWTGLHRRRDVSIFVHVALQDAQTGQLDLSGVLLRNADSKGIVALADRLDRQAAKVRDGTDEVYTQGRALFRWLPPVLIPGLVRVLEILSVHLNLDLRSLGVPQDGFGSALLTNIGALGLDAAWAPLVPYSGVPIVVALGAVKDRPWVNDGGELEVAPVLPLFATLDHRVLDGAHAARLSAALRRRLANPTAWLGPPSAAPAPR